AEADALLSELADEQPQRFDIRLMRYRVARNAGRRATAAERARELLQADAPDSDGIHAQQGALADLDGTDDALPLTERLGLARRWLAAGALDAVEAALPPLTGEAEGEDGDELAAR